MCMCRCFICHILSKDSTGIYGMNRQSFMHHRKAFRQDAQDDMIMRRQNTLETTSGQVGLFENKKSIEIKKHGIMNIQGGSGIGLWKERGCNVIEAKKHKQYLYRRRASWSGDDMSVKCHILSTPRWHSHVEDIVSSKKSPVTRSRFVRKAVHEDFIGSEGGETQGDSDDYTHYKKDKGGGGKYSTSRGVAGILDNHRGVKQDKEGNYNEPVPQKNALFYSIVDAALKEMYGNGGCNIERVDGRLLRRLIYGGILEPLKLCITEDNMMYLWQVLFISQFVWKGSVSEENVIPLVHNSSNCSFGVVSVERKKDDRAGQRETVQRETLFVKFVNTYTSVTGARYVEVDNPVVDVFICKALKEIIDEYRPCLREHFMTFVDCFATMRYKDTWDLYMYADLDNGVSPLVINDWYKYSWAYTPCVATVFQNINGISMGKMTPSDLIQSLRKGFPVFFKRLVALEMEYGFLHNDLHTGNIFWDYDTQTFRLIDYGRSYIDKYMNGNVRKEVTESLFKMGLDMPPDAARNLGNERDMVRFFNTSGYMHYNPHISEYCYCAVIWDMMTMCSNIVRLLKCNGRMRPETIKAYNEIFHIPSLEKNFNHLINVTMEKSEENYFDHTIQAFLNFVNTPEHDEYEKCLAEGVTYMGLFIYYCIHVRGIKKPIGKEVYKYFQLINTSVGITFIIDLARKLNASQHIHSFSDYSLVFRLIRSSMTKKFLDRKILDDMYNGIEMYDQTCPFFRDGEAVGNKGLNDDIIAKVENLNGVTMAENIPWNKVNKAGDISFKEIYTRQQTDLSKQGDVATDTLSCNLASAMLYGERIKQDALNCRLRSHSKISKQEDLDPLISELMTTAYEMEQSMITSAAISDVNVHGKTETSMESVGNKNKNKIEREDIRTVSGNQYRIENSYVAYNHNSPPMLRATAFAGIKHIEEYKMDKNTGP